MEDKQGIQVVFGKVLVEFRTANKLKQAELAERSQMDVTYISDLERGIYMPSLFTVLKLAKGLNISFQELASKIDDELNS